MILTDIEIFADASGPLALSEKLRLRLSPAPLAGWMLGFIDPFLKAKVSRSFSTETDPVGNPWAALAPLTIERRAEEGFPPGPIQYRSGEMASYLTSTNSDIRATTIGTQLTFPGGMAKGKLPYKVGSAQMGNRRTGAPPRPVLGMTLQDGAAITLGLAEYLTAGYQVA